MKKISKYYKCRIYPNKKQIELFETNFVAYAYVYNKSKLIYEKEYKENLKSGKKVVDSNKYFYDILKQLLKENNHLKQVDKIILIDAYHRLLDSINNYKTGLSQKPKFIKKTSTQSFRLQCTSKDKLKCKRLYLNDYGTFKLHDKREIQGKLKEVIIKKHNSQWFIILKCSDISITEYPKTNKKVGIDLGIKNLIIMSDGKSIKPPNISKIESKINKYNRKLSKQKENSKNYQKTVLMLHKLYIKRTNIIEDNLHKIAMEIVKDYDFIAMESLDIRNMIKNRRYSHSIYNMNWARLIKLIKINAELNNKTFIQIPQNYPSTKTCSNCKTINNNVTIDVREWECPKCNTYHDRDINAAKNILYKAIEMS